MCEYCKKIINIDNEEETHMEIINKKKSWGYMLYVEIEGQDNDGYKPSQFFQINYCPMCGRKLVKEKIRYENRNYKKTRTIISKSF